MFGLMANEDYFDVDEDLDYGLEDIEDDENKELDEDAFYDLSI